MNTRACLRSTDSTGLLSRFWILDFVPCILVCISSRSMLYFQGKEYKNNLSLSLSHVFIFMQIHTYTYTQFTSEAIQFLPS